MLRSRLEAGGGISTLYLPERELNVPRSVLATLITRLHGQQS